MGKVEEDLKGCRGIIYKLDRFAFPFRLFPSWADGGMVAGGRVWWLVGRVWCLVVRIWWLVGEGVW